MNNKISFISVLFTIILCSFIFFMGMNKESSIATQKLYRVYLSGEEIGIIDNEEKLYNLIDMEQKELKEEYGVNKIYPPNGLKVEPIYTYINKTTQIEDIYYKIKEEEPFTIEGYEVTIKSDEPIKLYILKKEDLDIAIRNTVESFVDKDLLQMYLDSTQKEVIDEGTTIKAVYLNEEITIKSAHISTQNKIFTNSNELSRYFLFGTLEPEKEYTVKLGDTISKVANNNELSVNEFLMVNPQIVSEKALLYPNQVVNISPVSPLVNIIEEATVVEKQVITYETTIEYDNSMPYGRKYVKQAGVNGSTKVTYNIVRVNNQDMETEFLKNEPISEPVEQIIVKGGFNLVYVGDSKYWAWPTKKPYKITSTFGWRSIFGKRSFHEGIDISGLPHGSDIFAIQNGTVIKTGKNDSRMGNYIYINHNNGYYSVYQHLSKILVNEGDTAIKGSVIGLMGNTGRSTGTHLHLGIFINGVPFAGGKIIDPLLLWYPE